MKSKGKKPSFTIVELLVVMSIIIILIAILVPSLNAVRRFAKDVTQKSQFHNITNALESINASTESEEGYPDSYALDNDGESYCGAMKLCEAMVGQDGLGFHQDSVFDNMGQNKDKTVDLYYNRAATKPTSPYTPAEEQNMRSRAKYLEGEDAQIAYISELSPTDQGPFDPCCALLCDVYKRSDLRRADGEKLGMPVLYYKADPSKLTHDANEGVTQGTNTYNYWDNHELLAIDVFWMPPGTKHPMYAADGKSQPFYSNTRDKAVTVVNKPYNPETFILISAGFDGLYGTRDDIFNFAE